MGQAVKLRDWSNLINPVNLNGTEKLVAKELPYTKFKVHAINEILLVYGSSCDITGWVKFD